MSNLPSLLALKPLLEDGSRALQKIADAEALERQCQRARDSEGMYKAAETKVLEQAKYVCLRDAAVAIARTTNPGPGRGHKNQVAKNQLGFPAGDPGKHTVHKWRKAFCRKNAEGRTEIDVEKMRLALEDAARRCVRVCEQEKISIIPGTEGTGEFLRYTPRDQVAAVRAALGEIDLDPASDALGRSDRLLHGRGQ